MTQLYFVRHAQPDRSWTGAEQERSLTDEGFIDREEVQKVRMEQPSAPY